MSDRRCLQRIVTLLNPRNEDREENTHEAFELARAACNRTSEDPPAVGDKVAAFSVAINALVLSRASLRHAIINIQSVLEGPFTESRKLSTIQAICDVWEEKDGA